MSSLAAYDIPREKIRQYEISDVKKQEFLEYFQGLPNTGLPEPYLEWSEYEQSLETLVAANVIKEGIGYRQVWKDVRIHPAYGTVEIRIADSMPSLIDTVAVATFVQALAIKIGNEWELSLIHI